jgi:hypothetical protein
MSTKKELLRTGFLHKTDKGWAVKWSDLHSFAHGTHWETTLIQESDQALYKDEDEDKKVNFKFMTLGFDEEKFYQITVAKVIDDNDDTMNDDIDGGMEPYTREEVSKDIVSAFEKLSTLELLDKLLLINSKEFDYCMSVMAETLSQLNNYKETNKIV